MIFGESGATSNRSELEQWQYLDKVLILCVYIHNIVEQFDKLPFHLKIEEEMCNY